MRFIIPFACSESPLHYGNGMLAVLKPQCQMKNHHTWRHKRFISSAVAPLRGASLCSVALRGAPNPVSIKNILCQRSLESSVLFLPYRFRALACCLPAGLLGAGAKLLLQQGWLVAGSTADISRWALRRCLPKGLANCC